MNYCSDTVSVVGLPKCHKTMLVGIVVQHFTSRENSKMEPPVLVHEPNRLPVPEILQVHDDDTAAINSSRLPSQAVQ